MNFYWKHDLSPFQKDLKKLKDTAWISYLEVEAYAGTYEMPKGAHLPNKKAVRQSQGSN